MQYRVPQFIEHQAKILGPLNVKQSMTIGVVLVICFFLYFAIGEENFFLFILLAGLLTGIALAISFYKVQGQSLPVVMKNWTSFNISPRLFLWKRKRSPVFLSTERERRAITIVKQEKSPLKMRDEGKIEELIKKIDFEE
ncbi:MAG: hypothetical protein PHI91_01165 [Candidatus Pacebacteria bacterium]|nr:hypothetical protein [Candidatus Paceibacterota bacterium]MDD2757145.1 hypothetical protein [Candidatus Paceibacterota bacterium]MDD3283584.1 hypothetical protein [Candidatus Paceibacterota bacterium]MDD3969793.1 hypothetical protein [Candidatus Paceibacterota bacterium]MDD4738204.1 hypothetical protein [Candidatus Paceibacterota bacterium]